MKFIPHPSSGLLMVLVGLTLAGCSGKVTRLTGTVTFDGEPLGRFQVSLMQADQSTGGAVAGAFTKADGSYEIRNVRAGSYKVIIHRHRGPQPPGGGGPVTGPESLPPNYSDPKQTELTAELEQGKQTVKDFALTSKP